jgi:hypothetical protein
MRKSLVVLAGLVGFMAASISHAAEVECAGRILEAGKIVKTFRVLDEDDEALSAEVDNMAVVGSIEDNGLNATLVNISIGEYKDGEMVKGASMVFDVSSRKTLLSKNRLNEPTLRYVENGKTYLVSCRLKGSSAVGNVDMFK